VKLTDRKMRRMCGADKLNRVTSDGNFFRVTFKSNDAYDATGFEATYQFRKHKGLLSYLFIYLSISLFQTTEIHIIIIIYYEICTQGTI